MKILHLTLQRKWFDLIASGKKTDEYREARPHWKKRLVDQDNKIRIFDEVHFRNGYDLAKPFMRVEFLGCILTHSDPCHPKNGEILNGVYFHILLGHILEIKGALSDVKEGDRLG